MTPSKIEEFVIRHDAGLAVVDVSLGNLTDQQEKSTKAISDLSTRLAGWVEESKEGSMKIEIRLALIEKEIADLNLANDSWPDPSRCPSDGSLQPIPELGCLDHRRGLLQGEGLKTRPSHPPASTPARLMIN